MNRSGHSGSRREFLAAAMGAAVQFAVAPKRNPGQKSVTNLRLPPMDKVRVGFVGTGSRGGSLLGNLLDIDGVEIRAVCDVVPERVRKAQQRATTAGRPEPAGYPGSESGFEKLCGRDDLDAVYIATPWDSHAQIAVAAMRNGKHAMIEVPAAITVEECWQLVDTAEQTQRHCMMLENCCYGELEMLVLSMVRQGVLGELTHAEGGYLHDLRDVILGNDSGSVWRRRFMQRLNGNLYPTHGLGMIAQCMDIHSGDRFESLVSMSSPERALSRKRDALPAGDPRRSETFACGDVNTSLIRTALGRTIMLQVSFAMSRPYSRINLVSGTAGTFCDYPPRIHLDGKGEDWETDLAPYHEKYGHPLWKRNREVAAKSGGHGGMDYLMNLRLIQCLREGLPLDMSVYDAAAWSSVFPVSIASVSARSAPVSFPDFTRGDWKTRRA
jgi:predicted dehydrogenase